MKYFLRPYTIVGAAALLGATLGWLAAPPGAMAQSGLSHILQEINPLLSHSQGYLGVLVSDVDNENAGKLRLKEARGAMITLIDHDAPAGQNGLRVNDVVLSVNGQNVENSDQFGRILKEIPAGRKITMIISRDGAQQTVTVQLVDRKTMEQDVWNKMNRGDGFAAPPTGMGILPNGGDGVSGMHMSLFGSTLKVGAMVEALTPQMADYLGVQNGVMIKQVAHKSEAAAAGLKAFDVVLKVGNEPIKTTADWDRALRSNEGRQVQVTILRERKQQTVNLQVDSKHRGAVQWTDLFEQEECPLVAELDMEPNSELRQQMQEFREQFDGRQMEELGKEVEAMRDNFKAGAFPELKIDPKQLQELEKQMEAFRQSFHADEFRIDPKQMEELNRQMEEFRKSLPREFRLDRDQMIKLGPEIEQLRRSHSAFPA